MLFLAGSFDGLQVGVFIFVCFVLAGTIWLYRSSMESLKKLQEEQRKQYSHLIEAMDAEWNHPSWTSRLTKSLQNFLVKAGPGQPAKSEAAVISPLTPVDLMAVKHMMEQQQQLSQRLLTQIEQLQTPHTVEKRSSSTGEENRRVEELEMLVEQKEEELQQLQREQKLTEKLASKFEQVQQDFSYMQERIMSLEQQAAQSARLAIELEDSRAAYMHLFNDLSRKSEKLQQALQENAQLREQLADTEDKLQEANLQRQQLFKKVKLLEELNNELQAVTDTNQKLQTELRRIGELESMLNMIIEERNQLLRK
ncbi:MAG TPA: hypothetical protein VD794_10910 [Flavisolibacter sp.]|nr:hypothetical protein [Flavisolibacter sp.]